MKKILVKLGGTLLDQQESRLRLAHEITLASDPERVFVVVHGGGKQMTRFLTERGVESQFINGLRVTDPSVIDAVVKVFRGSVNSDLVTAFRAAGNRPVGLSGLDAGLVDAVILDPQLGQVGRPVASDARLLDVLTMTGYLPVVACIAGDSSGNIFNVNGDQMAVTCAASFHADQLFFLTDVDGVKGADGAVFPQLTVAECRKLIADGVATGGMQAKLESAIDAILKGVGEVLIAPGAHVGIVEKLLDHAPIGTRILR
ncbi:MAG: acetylglutamate kinase [Bryobacteraceae bacterium]